jgi:hypothetical protein
MVFERFCGVGWVTTDILARLGNFVCLICLAYDSLFVGDV